MFEQVDPVLLEDRWPFVEKGLRKILDHCPDWWQPEDLQARILNGVVALHLHADGFVILERVFTPLGLPYLNVWCMYFLPGKGVKHKDALIGWLDDKKRELRCAFIQFSSQREEWASMIEGHFEKHMTTWRRK